MNKKWWETTAVYHIYPRSFKDTTENGVGDLRGIIEKLDYIKELGIGSIWISPFFLSPGNDHGYDISDFLSIDPEMGTMDTVEELIQEVHNRDMKIIFDMVMNHTSIEHQWFKESRSSKDNPKRDWYIWSKGKSSTSPPNNWKSMIGKRGWTYDEITNEWYYSSFLDFQPDLNYSNQEVRDAMFSTVRFWLDKGVDGFRLDIFNCIGKNMDFPNNPFYPKPLPTPDNNDHGFWQHKKHNINLPSSAMLAKELRKVIDEYPDRFLIGEVSGNHSILRDFMGSQKDGLNLVFQFELLHFKFTKDFFYKFIQSMEEDFGNPYLPVLVYSNHDNGRGISRVAGDISKGKILALIQLTSRGVPVIYNGEEIGMIDHDIPLKKAEDPLAKNYLTAPKWLSKKLDVYLNRDDCRTPMQWSAEKNRGFTTAGVDPWLPTVPFTQGRDVESQNSDPESLLNFYRQLLNFRYSSKLLNSGDLELLKSNKNILMYRRIYKEQSLLVIVNFNKKSFNMDLSSYNYNNICLSTNSSNQYNSKEKSLFLMGISGVMLVES